MEDAAERLEAARSAAAAGRAKQMSEEEMVRLYFGKDEPTQYSRELWARICRNYEISGNFRAACETEGVDEASGYNWLTRQPGCRRAYERARARFVQGSFLEIGKQAQLEWRAAEAKLRLAMPDEYGQQITVRHEERQAIVIDMVRVISLVLEELEVPGDLQEAIASRLLERAVEAEPRQALES